MLISATPKSTNLIPYFRKFNNTTIILFWLLRLSFFLPQKIDLSRHYSTVTYFRLGPEGLAILAIPRSFIITMTVRYLYYKLS